LEVSIKSGLVHFLPLSMLKNIFVRISAIFFAWYLFGFMSYFPSIDGLKWRTAIRIATICSFCGFGLWFATVKFAARHRLLKLFLLIPSLIIFPIVSYSLDPTLLCVAILSLLLAIHNIISAGRPNDRPSQT
jgi:hypothetical protein